MVATFSNSRWDALPCERMLGCSFADDFLTIERSEQNYGTDTGTGNTADFGLTTDGNGYFVYDIVSQPSGFSVVVRFSAAAVTTPGILIASHNLEDDVAGDGFCIWVDATGVRANHSDGATIPTKCSVDVDYDDSEIHTVTYVVDMVGGTHKLYVDALDVDSQTTTINTEIGLTTSINVAGDGTDNFVGTISKTRVFNALLAETEHDLYHADTLTSWYFAPLAAFRCDAFNNDTVGNKILDRTVDLNDLTKGDGEIPQTYPQFWPAIETEDARYAFNGLSTYISGLMTLPTNYTITACKSTSAAPWPSMEQHNDLTFMDDLTTIGAFTGKLRSIIIHSGILTALQLLHDEYMHLYWQWRGRAFGAYHRLITEGNCIFAMFLDDEYDTFDDYSANEADGSDTLVTQSGLDGCTFASPTSNVESPDETGLRTENISISVLGDFAGSEVAGTIIDKGYDYKLLTNGNQIEFNGSTIAHTFDNNRQIAVTSQVNKKPRFFVDGEYIGEGTIENANEAEFKVLDGTNGISQLPTSWTTNGVTKNPSFMYAAEDITAVGTWPARYGDDLTLAGTGTDPTINVNSFGNDSDIGAVKFNSITNGYVFPNIAPTQFDKDDFILEFVFRVPSEMTTNQFYVLWTSRGTTNGLYIYVRNSILNIFIQDDDSHAASSTHTVIPGAVYHAVIAGEYGGSQRLYLNGLVADTDSIATLTGDIGNDIAAAIGYRRSESGKGYNTGQILYAAAWHGLNWFAAGGFDQDDNVSERFHKWAGTYATAEGDSEPTVNSRDCAGYMEKWNATESRYDLILCGENLPRVSQVKDDNGDLFEDCVLIEPAATNVCTESEDLDDWTKYDVTVNTSTGVGIDSSFDMHALIASVNNVNHYLRSAFTVTTTSTAYSCYAKKGAADYLLMFTNTGGTSTVLFNLANGTIESETNSTGSIVDMGNGIYRISMFWTSTIGANTMRFYIQETTGTTTFAGDGSSDYTYIWGVQLEAGNKATSLITTDGATATRLKDQLRYDGTNNTGDQQGTISAEILTDDYANAVDCTVLSLNDGGAANDSIELELDTTTGVGKFDVVAGGVVQAAVTGTTDLTDDVDHTIRGIYANNDCRLLVDGASEGTPDTSCTIPNDIDRIEIGQNQAAAEQLNGWIRNVQIFKRSNSGANEDLTVGNNNAHSEPTQYPIKQVYIGSEPLTDEEINALYEQSLHINTIEMPGP